MTPSEILEGCQRDGISLSVTADRNLAFEGESYALAFWLPQLRKHKSEVVDALSPKPRSCRECRHFASTVTYASPVSIEQVKHDYPQMEATPLIDIDYQYVEK